MGRDWAHIRTFARMPTVATASPMSSNVRFPKNRHPHQEKVGGLDGRPANLAASASKLGTLANLGAENSSQYLAPHFATTRGGPAGPAYPLKFANSNADPGREVRGPAREVNARNSILANGRGPSRGSREGRGAGAGATAGRAGRAADRGGTAGRHRRWVQSAAARECQRPDARRASPNFASAPRRGCSDCDDTGPWPRSAATRARRANLCDTTSVRQRELLRADRGAWACRPGSVFPHRPQLPSR